MRNKDLNARILGKIRRYHLSIVRFLSTLVVKIKLTLLKIEYSKNLTAYGKVYFYRFPYSKIEIGEGVEFRSDKTSNQIGLMRRCIVSTLSPEAQIVIGENCGLSGVSIGAEKGIYIGANVMVGANSLITDTNWHNVHPEKRQLRDPEPGEVIIEDNVFIGYGSIILKNVRIGKNSVIGAGSVVTKNIPANVIAAGNPCRVIKKL